MKKHGAAKGILKDIKTDDSLCDDESLQSNIDEDSELSEAVYQRRNQEKSEGDSDGL